MNILILAPLFPYPFSQGGKIRICNIIKYLSVNHKITLACLSADKVNDYGPLRDYCEEIVVIYRKTSTFTDLTRFSLGREPFNYLKYSSVKMRDTLADLIKKKSFDIVQIEFSMMWQYADIFKGIPLVLDAHNVESEIVGQLKETSGNPLKKLPYVREEKRLRQNEEKAWRECEACFAVSGEEREFISSHSRHPESVFTVPNGVDLGRFEFHPKNNIDNRVLFIGGLEYNPNFDSAIYLLKEIYPEIKAKVSGIKLDIVGRRLDRILDLASSEDITLHENIPDVLPWFREADLLVVPLRQGAGTRIKVLEAMAAGLPVVTTAKGCEGLEVRHEEHLLIADTTEAFAHAVRKILKDTDLRNQMTKNARHLVEQKYSWEMIAREMEGHYESITTVNSK